MGVETEAEYSGAECSFTSAIIVIEGMTLYAWIKQSCLIVSSRACQGRSFCQCTLRRSGTYRIHKCDAENFGLNLKCYVRTHWLVPLFASTVTKTSRAATFPNSPPKAWEASACLKLDPVPMHLLSRLVQLTTVITTWSTAARCGSPTRVKLISSWSLQTCKYGQSRLSRECIFSLNTHGTAILPRATKASLALSLKRIWVSRLQRRKARFVKRKPLIHIWHQLTSGF